MQTILICLMYMIHISSYYILYLIMFFFKKLLLSTGFREIFILAKLKTSLLIIVLCSKKYLK